MRYDFEPRIVNVRSLHICESLNEIPILCIDDHGKLLVNLKSMMMLLYVGIEIKIHILCCDGEAFALTLTCAQFWPANPLYPQYAVSFGLLDWAESLLRKC